MQSTSLLQMRHLSRMEAAQWEALLRTVEQGINWGQRGLNAYKAGKRLYSDIAAELPDFGNTTMAIQGPHLRGSVWTGATSQKKLLGNGEVDFTSLAAEDSLLVRTDKRVKNRRGRFATIHDGHGWDPYVNDNRPFIEKLIMPIVNIMGKVIRTSRWEAQSGQTKHFYFPIDTVQDIISYMKIPYTAQITSVPTPIPGEAGTAGVANDIEGRTFRSALLDQGQVRVHKLQHRFLIKNISNYTVKLNIKEWTAKKDGSSQQSVENLHYQEIENDSFGPSTNLAIDGLALWGTTTTVQPRVNTVNRGIGQSGSPIYPFWEMDKHSRVWLPPGALIEYHLNGNIKHLRQSDVEQWQTNYINQGALPIEYIKGLSRTVTFTLTGQLVDCYREKLNDATSPANENNCEAKEITTGWAECTMTQESNVAVSNPYKVNTPQVTAVFGDSGGLLPYYWSRPEQPNVRRMNVTNYDGEVYNNDN